MIRPSPLDPPRFAAFGHVARKDEAPARALRGGQVLLTRTEAAFRHDARAGRHSLDFYEVQPERGPFQALQAERHPHSAQMFVPMRAEAFLVIVWEGDPREGARPRAFVGGPEDVVIYHPGQWHHGIVALGVPALFASTMWRMAGGTDTEFAPLAQPLAVALPGALG